MVVRYLVRRSLCVVGVHTGLDVRWGRTAGGSTRSCEVCGTVWIAGFDGLRQVWKRAR